MGISGTVPIVNDYDTWRYHLEDNRKSNKLMVVDFSVRRIGTFETMGKFVQGLASKYRDVKFITLNADKFSGVVKVNEIESLPSFLLMKSGHEWDRVVGTCEDELENMIKKYRV